MAVEQRAYTSRLSKNRLSQTTNSVQTQLQDYKGRITILSHERKQNRENLKELSAEVQALQSNLQEAEKQRKIAIHSKNKATKELTELVLRLKNELDEHKMAEAELQQKIAFRAKKMSNSNFANNKSMEALDAS